MKCDESFCMGAIIVLLMILAFNTCDANAADHAIVSFDNAEHLVALQDSVVGVCDTTWWALWWHIENSEVIDSIVVNGKIIYPYDITCRRLVGVTVTKFPGITESVNNVYRDLCVDGGKTIPGEAIIFYEKVKCIK